MDPILEHGFLLKCYLKLVFMLVYLGVTIPNLLIKCVAYSDRMSGWLMRGENHLL